MKLPSYEKLNLTLKKDYRPSETSAAALRDLRWYLIRKVELEKRYSDSEDTFP